MAVYVTDGVRENKECMTDVCVCVCVCVCVHTDTPSRYNEKEQRSMLVWCPNSLISDAMCKHTHYTII